MNRIEPGRTVEIIAMLAERWPACFAIYEKRRRPLKVGIDKDIAAAIGDIVSMDELKVALRAYVSNEAYLDACFVGAWRIDLDGNVVGTVTAEQAVRAAALVVRKIRARAAARAKTKSSAPAVSDAAAAAPGIAPAGIAPAVRRTSLADLKMAAMARKAASTVSDRAAMS
jgi:sRNA-binding protein